MQSIKENSQQKKYIVPLVGLFRTMLDLKNDTQFSSCESISEVIFFGAVWKTLLSSVNCGAYHTVQISVHNISLI